MVHHRVYALFLSLRTGIARGARPCVATSAKGSACPGHDNASDTLVYRNIVNRSVQRIVKIAAQRVEAVGPIELEDRYPPFPLYIQHHVGFPSSLPVKRLESILEIGRAHV